MASPPILRFTREAALAAFSLFRLWFSVYVVRVSAQLGLFDDAGLEARFSRLSALAARVPPGVRFGTSSWSFPGWKGLVYSTAITASQLARDGLGEYVRHPLFGTVGIDRSYYAPIPEDDLRRYASQLPPGFPCCCKAPASVTSPLMPDRQSAEANPDFLSAGRLAAELLDPIDRVFRDHAGPIILQFPRMLRRAPIESVAFYDGLAALLASLPAGFRFAVELRDRQLLTPAYVQVLSDHGAAHVYNLQTAMPRPGEQAALFPPEAMPFVMVRLLLQPDATYEQQREAFAPFDAIAAPDEGMRAEVADIVGRAVARAIPAYVLVNNKAEGSAPLTIEALAEALARRA
jgi:uncharacterized protein YecE (DUF72 family)